MLPLLLLIACNPDPRTDDALENLGGVGYRDGIDGGATSGERGTVAITEIHWAGSVTNDGDWDRSDVFVEVRNQGSMPVNLSGWYLVLDGAVKKTWRFPASDLELGVGEEAYVASKDDGCFVDPDWVIPDLAFPYGDPIEVTLLDRDERLIEPAGSDDMPPFAGGYDLVDARSMERIQLMFGARGTSPHIWHHYTDAQVQVPNNDKVAERCREHTLASPGRPNSPDYSGAYASGSFD